MVSNDSRSNLFELTHHSATFAAKQLRDDVDAIKVLTAGLHVLAQDIECFAIGNHRLFHHLLTRWPPLNYTTWNLDDFFNINQITLATSIHFPKSWHRYYNNHWKQSFRLRFFRGSHGSQRPQSSQRHDEGWHCAWSAAFQLRRALGPR